MEEYKNSREKTEPQWRYILRLILNIMIPASGWFFLCFLGPKLLGFFMPFVVGWIIAMIANPLVRFLESGIRVTVNTDDMGIERTCLSKEFDYLKREFGLTEEQQKQVVLNATDAAFASEETKKMLREKILKVYGASL